MQESVVAFIVFCALFVVLKRYAPNGLKRATRSWFALWATQFGWQALAQKITAKAENGASCGTGCGSCGSCGTAAIPNQTSENETSISVDALKRTIRR